MWLSACPCFLATAVALLLLMERVFGPVLAKSAALYTLYLVVSGTIFVAAYGLAGGSTDFTLYPAIAGAYVIARLVGLLTPGAPAGLGVREAVLLFLLGGLSPGPVILLAVVIGRAITVLGDLFFLPAGRLLVECTGQPMKETDGTTYRVGLGLLGTAALLIGLFVNGALPGLMTPTTGQAIDAGVRAVVRQWFLDLCDKFWLADPCGHLIRTCCGSANRTFPKDRHPAGRRIFAGIRPLVHHRILRRIQIRAPHRRQGRDFASVRPAMAYPTRHMAACRLFHGIPRNRAVASLFLHGIAIGALRAKSALMHFVLCSHSVGGLHGWLQFRDVCHRSGHSSPR